MNIEFNEQQQFERDQRDTEALITNIDKVYDLWAWGHTKEKCWFITRTKNSPCGGSVLLLHIEGIKSDSVKPTIGDIIKPGDIISTTSGAFYEVQTVEWL